MELGARYIEQGRSFFTVWAPLQTNLILQIVHPEKREVSMKKDEWGYFSTTVDGVNPHDRYFYKLDDGSTRPDPASAFQPTGVHEASAVVDHTNFEWKDAQWKGIHLEQMIIYEIHTGTFTPEGTFEAIIPRLDALGELGINVIELMPVAQFPGERNWGYDGAYPFAVQNSYGGPVGLKKLINVCHQKGMAVILDVVYNHLGPEGNYLPQYGPYFTNRYTSPWGDAINYDGPYSYGVRNYFVQNALYWMRHYHIDALRLDAVHGIFDMSAKHILQELAENVASYCKEAEQKYYLIAESDLNDSRVIRPIDVGGYGVDAQWSDDFHHALFTILTGEKQGYYEDFGSVRHLAKAFEEGFVYAWEYSPYRKRQHGNYAGDLPGWQFVVCSQNHDQVGNRLFGERLSTLVDLESLKLAAAVVLSSPYVPLLFMGEEYGEEAPFQYFVSHSDPELIKAVRKGRKEEFAAFQWEGTPPDPEDEKTFNACKLTWENRNEGKGQLLHSFYKKLIELRKELPAFQDLRRESVSCDYSEEDMTIYIIRTHDSDTVYCIYNFNTEPVNVTGKLPEGKWIKVIDSSDTIWHGPGATLGEALEAGQPMTLQPRSFALYQKK